MPLKLSAVPASERYACVGAVCGADAAGVYAVADCGGVCA
eukprot:gene12184-biopygen860